MKVYLHPERFDRSGAFFVDGEAVREVDDLVLGPVDHQDRRRDARNLVNAEISNCFFIKRTLNYKICFVRARG